MVVQTWTDIVASSLQRLWLGFAGFIPTLIGAVIIFIIGLIVAYGLGTLVEKIFVGLRLDTLLNRLGLSPYFERAGVRLKGSYFLGRLTYWFIVVAFLLAASDIVGLYAFSNFLRDVLFYIPNIVAAVLIMLASFVIGNILRKVVMASVMSAKMHAPHFLASLTWWTVVIAGFLTALTQLRIATNIIQTLVTGFIAMLALAGGLAFGLGGRDFATSLINKFKENIGSQ